ncbi:hypothetical protein [Nocardioides sp. GY 10127]|uniref:hypothetical protein n=1 Tax=Nocardioides sp. GY 10127 TaxID=2569762 RepID=UPI0010A7BE7D|nr:hypothetical protein [Nocardioides sp. GY 10127]TIC82821.1 hypothetical protein E8D37_09110 [Nocardioides sp. GY 10127]
MRRDILASNLVAGAVGLALLIPMGSWPLLLCGVPYVVVASLFLARAYRGPAMTTRREALTWLAPWAGNSAIWVPLFVTDFGNGASAGVAPTALAVLYGLLLAGLLCVAWQLMALFLRVSVRGRVPETGRGATPGHTTAAEAVPR